MILIVDDDPSVTASLGLLLKQGGYASHASAGPSEALAWLSSHEPELVLQDMNFSRQTSGEEGLALLAKVREAHPGVPVVLITAWGSVDLAVRGMKAGASDFIVKPWTNEQHPADRSHRARPLGVLGCRHRAGAQPRGAGRADTTLACSSEQTRASVESCRWPAASQRRMRRC